jgi:hypothetical protein
MTLSLELDIKPKRAPKKAARLTNYTQFELNWSPLFALRYIGTRFKEQLSADQIKDDR